MIARLDVKGENVIKGIHLEGLRKIGNPNDLARRYYQDGIDEIIYMDVVASLYGRNNILDIVRETARDIFVPLTVGGGMRSLEDITDALRAGADKVAINTAAISRPEFLREASLAFGSQCIVLSIEAKSEAPGQWTALTDNGREHTGVDVLDWVRGAEALGIGEVLLTSVDQEGTQSGFDERLVAAVRDVVQVPVIASGGAGEPAHVASLYGETGCDAVACAALLHYEKTSVSGLKRHLDGENITVRL
ncbi:MAG: imidazole glycerol phosphate synthase cyclase subunit [Rhodospirillaceae bacterium]|nr:imidazole glycerol phosphate synthase cyclase subunit [Rhodospirillaceae bacterium]MDD9929665.1 imidazole glycerol phosphate synthase cyclase subunit [Rhodospirillaceae bacterium]